MVYEPDPSHSFVPVDSQTWDVDAMADGAGAVRSGGEAPGQPHDRIPHANVSMPAAANDAHEQPADVSIGSRMLSAVSGSILTSLLVTPLDVVRVRLQSQPSQPQPTSAPELRPNPNFPFPRAFENLPPNLGITQCCKEVFWVNNNTPYCVVDTHPAGAAAIGPSGAEAAAAECAVEETQRRTFTSTLDGLRKIARNEGVTTLWRGLSPTLAMAVPGNVVYFAGYDWLRTAPRSPFVGRISDAYAPLVAGSTARILAAICVSPIELFRTRMQASRASSAAENFYETLAGVRDMVTAQGPRSLWRGLTLTLWRDVPFSALYWWGYEGTRDIITDARARARDGGADGPGSRNLSDLRIRQDHTTTLVDSFAAGALSGGVAAILTTPFDVGKTRQQVFRFAGDAAKPQEPSSGSALRATLRPEDRSMPRFLWHIFKEEGMSGLFKGWAARTLKVAPACAIMISTYEIGKKYAQRRKLDLESEAEERG